MRKVLFFDEDREKVDLLRCDSFSLGVILL